MNEPEFLEKWQSEKPIYKAWGDFVVEQISESLVDKGVDLGVFLKVPAKVRLKDDKSLIDKAFYRPGKNYSDPYNDIEDKVGARFVVLLLEDISRICEVVESSESWTFDACKHFDLDKENSPLLFTYQSVHYVVRPKQDVQFDGVSIPSSTPCELQIRTLLQHAHAELTHDAVYKAKRTVQPKVHRTVAKSIALIETADDFFADVSRQLNSGPLVELGILDRLDGLYYSRTGIKPFNQKSSLVIWDEFEDLLGEGLFENIQTLVESNPFIPDCIKQHYPENSLYQQSVAFFIYWLIKRKKNRLLADWPLDRKLLEPFASDLGVSLWGGD
ncbi:GTP pyrophosphokinase family protein [Microbulbifer sp. ARAS458-1]|uniref:GTP pyrophosphokinase n=1 Tax=Microbulbifer sp. ARAS458-1 TaxID=3140242 RepID=UPI0038781A4B